MGNTKALEVLWLTPDKPDDISVGRRRVADELTADGHTVVLRGTTPGNVWTSLTDEHEYDVVVGTTRAGAIAGALVAKARRIPFVVDHIDPIRQLRETHSAPVAEVVERLENHVFRLADHVLFVYAEEEPRVSRHAGALTQTDLGVDYDTFAEPDPAIVDSARERLGDIDGDVLVYVGGLEPIYSIEEIVASIEYLDGWTLVVAGTGSLEPVVSAAAAERDDVTFLGTVPHEEVAGYLHNADVGVALVDDPHTLKVLEYAAAGLPVVQQSGRAERRFDGLVEFCEADPEAIARAVQRAEAMGSSREFAEFAEQFDWANVADDYRAALESVTTRD